MDSLLTNITKKKEDILIKTNDTIYQITTTENQKNNTNKNISTIDLGECENILKDKYNINKTLSLIIFKVDYYKEGSLIPVICYEVYEPINKTQLDLNYCKDILVNLDIPVSIDEDNIYKHDANSEFYNDKCYAYTTENGTDIILNDRQIEYNDNNLSICENNCVLKGYDTDTKKVSCDCETKSKICLISDIIDDDTILSSNFSNADSSSSSITTMKCIDTLFSKEGLLTNIGSYILLFTIIFFCIAAIVFYKCGYLLIENHIIDITSLKGQKPDINKKNKMNIFGYKKKNTKKGKKKKNNKKQIIAKPNPVKKKYYKKSFNEKDKDNNNLYNSKSDLKIKKFLIINDKNKIGTTFYKTQKKNISEIINYNDFELNSFNYQKALLYDKRTFSQYYLFLLKIKNILLFSFYPIEDYNIKIIKLSLFFLFFDIYFAVNTLFFNDSSIHQIYLDQGEYNLSYFFPQIIYSFIISYIISTIIKYYSLSERYLLQLKKDKDVKDKDSLINEGEKIKKCLIIKYIIFFVLGFIFLIIFWFYLSSFCAVYKNSQVYVIKNSFISFVISFIYQFIFILLPTAFRLFSLKRKQNEFIFKLSQILKIM